MSAIIQNERDMYTGKHLDGKKVIKHTKTKDYYFIWHPMEVNINTGNACVRLDQVLKFDKNFIFQYIGDNNQMKNVLISKCHVIDNIFPCRKNIKDEEGIVVDQKLFYMIKIPKIFELGKEIEL